MRRTALACLAVAALVLTLALAQAPPRADAQGPPPGAPGGPPPGGPPPAAMAGMPIDSFIAERDSMTKVVLEQLGERKSMAAESVFKNLKVIKGVPAQRLLAQMNGMSHALGVSCRHCHVPGHWADEDKKNKDITRQMMSMNRAINQEYLAKMDFGEDKPFVNCMTCHRGEREPMMAMRAAMRPQGGPGAPSGGPPPERR